MKLLAARNRLPAIRGEEEKSRRRLIVQQIARSFMRRASTARRRWCFVVVRTTKAYAGASARLLDLGGGRGRRQEINRGNRVPRKITSATVPAGSRPAGWARKAARQMAWLSAQRNVNGVRHLAYKYGISGAYRGYAASHRAARSAKCAASIVKV